VDVEAISSSEVGFSNWRVEIGHKVVIHKITAAEMNIVIETRDKLIGSLVFCENISPVSDTSAKHF
jgi:hypothetical protein